MRKKGSRNSEMDKKTDRKGGRNLYSPCFQACGRPVARNLKIPVYQPHKSRISVPLHARQAETGLCAEQWDGG